jgi:hypothetical protein
MNKNLGVGVAGTEAMTSARQDIAQLGVVVDLAVVDYRDRLILVPHRLCTSGYVQDREPTVAKMHPRAGVNGEALSIWAAMTHRSGHRAKVETVALTDKASDTAHQASLRKLMSSLILYEV